MAQGNEQLGGQETLSNQEQADKMNADFYKMLNKNLNTVGESISTVDSLTAQRDALGSPQDVMNNPDLFKKWDKLNTKINELKHPEHYNVVEQKNTQEQKNITDTKNTIIEDKKTINLNADLKDIYGNSVQLKNGKVPNKTVLNDAYGNIVKVSNDGTIAENTVLRDIYGNYL